MVGPGRHEFVLFGSSIVEFSFGDQGWGSILADIYSRKADILVRGYKGWNSRDGLKVVHKIFTKDAAVQPSLVIVYFGGNDSVRYNPDMVTAHVPLPEYIDNMRKMGLHLKSLSDKTRVIFLSPPPVNNKWAFDRYGDLGRTNESCKLYSDACLKVCEEIGIKGIDLWTALQQRDDWLTACLTEDGVHLSAKGSKIVAKEILKVLRGADWEPSLHWSLVPSEFVGVSPNDPEDSDASINRKLQWE